MFFLDNIDYGERNRERRKEFGARDVGKMAGGGKKRALWGRHRGGEGGHCQDSPLEKCDGVSGERAALVQPVLVSFPAPLCEPAGELCFPVFLASQGVPCHPSQHTRHVGD